jgi:hypothetical protein
MSIMVKVSGMSQGRRGGLDGLMTKTREGTQRLPRKPAPVSPPPLLSRAGEREIGTPDALPGECESRRCQKTLYCEPEPSRQTTALPSPTTSPLNDCHGQ